MNERIKDYNIEIRKRFFIILINNERKMNRK
jgi:hypothetical protein